MNISWLFAAAMPFLAQTPAPQLPDLPKHKTMLDTLIAAGPVMGALLILSIIFVMLVVTFLLTIRRGSVVSSGFMATADALLRKRDYLGLLAVSNRHGVVGTVSCRLSAVDCLYATLFALRARCTTADAVSPRRSVTSVISGDAPSRNGIPQYPVPGLM